MLDGPRSESVVVAQVTVPPEDFRLGHALAACETIRVELEQVVPLGSDRPPFAWISGSSTERAERAVAADADVRRLQVVDRDGARLLARLTWIEEELPFLAALFEGGATCTKCVGRDGSWHFTLRFPTHESFSSFLKRCSKGGMDITLNSVRPHWKAEGTHGGDLTPSQYEILSQALDEGYFSIPREITLAELAAELDISDTAASQRIRRGVQTVLGAELQTQR